MSSECAKMDLLCCESAIEIECRAIVDPVLLNDDRVLHNMLGQEEKYTPSTPYFSCVQKDVTAPMRTIVSNWMLEVRTCKDRTGRDNVPGTASGRRIPTSCCDSIGAPGPPRQPRRAPAKTASWTLSQTKLPPISKLGSHLALG